MAESKNHPDGCSLEGKSYNGVKKDFKRGFLYPHRKNI
jgi:hypothetical protein